jgi:hypothetical protein
MPRQVSRLRAALFAGIYTDDPNQRQSAMGNLMAVVRTWATQLLQTPTDTAELAQLMRVHLLTMLRMSFNCPFVDVRDTFTAFLLGLQVPLHPWDGGVMAGYGDFSTASDSRFALLLYSPR